MLYSTGSQNIDHFRRQNGSIERAAREITMTVKRLANIPGFSIDRVAAAAGNDPEVLRLENLDTDLAPPAAAIAATQAAIGRDETNRYLPFTGELELREVVARRLCEQTGFNDSP